MMVRSRGLLIIMLLVAGCAAPKPILYPNAHLQKAGKEVANRDIDECREMAKDAGATASQGKSSRSPAAPRQEARLDLQPEQWVEPWLPTQAAAQWLGQPVVQQRGSCADFSSLPSEHCI